MDDVYSLLDQVFEWDRRKAARNAVEHGVRFPEAATVFFDEHALFERDCEFIPHRDGYHRTG